MASMDGREPKTPAHVNIIMITKASGPLMASNHKRRSQTLKSCGFCLLIAHFQGKG